jgi:hypothetical protein
LRIPLESGSSRRGGGERWAEVLLRGKHIVNDGVRGGDLAPPRRIGSIAVRAVTRRVRPGRLLVTRVDSEVANGVVIDDDPRTGRERETARRRTATGPDEVATVQAREACRRARDDVAARRGNTGRRGTMTRDTIEYVWEKCCMLVVRENHDRGCVSHAALAPIESHRSSRQTG